jgi:hypothetical protein
MARTKTQSTAQPSSAAQLEPSFGDVEILDGMDRTLEGVKIDVLGSQVVMYVMEQEDNEHTRAYGRKPTRVDRLTKARMIRHDNGDLEYVGRSDHLKETVGTSDNEARWILTPRPCLNCP